MSSGGRAASASNSKKVKQRLVQILFGKKYTKQGREAHRHLDYATYTYEELRKAYFEQVQLLHPDKNASKMLSENETLKISRLDSPMEPIEGNWKDVEDTLKRHNARNKHEEFIDLQEAWEDYHGLSKAIKKGCKTVEGDFTMFGVGCSFSDSPAEQRRRSEIMDQAGRGWFSAGQLAEVCPENDSVKTNSEIIPEWSINSKIKSETGSVRSFRKIEDQRRHIVRNGVKKTLIDHLLPKRR